MRKPRLTRQGATYHVTAKTNRGEFIFEDDNIKELFCSVVDESRDRYDFRLTNYSVMTNHVHMLIEPLEGTELSRMLQWIFSVFACRYNKMTGQKGHVWYDRFKSKIVRTFLQWINTFNYITNNPVKAGLCHSPEKYFYSGMHELKKKRFRLLNPPDNWISALFQ